MKKAIDKDVRDEITRLEALGFAHEGYNGNGHHRLRHPQLGVTILPNTPSDHRWLDNCRSQVAKMFGISKRELLLNMGITPPKSGRTKAGGHKALKKQQAFRAEVAEVALPEVDPVALLPIDEQIEIKSEQRQEARRAGKAALAARLDSDLVHLFAEKRSRRVGMFA